MEGRDVPIIGPMRRTSDESGIILNWLVKLAVLLAVLAVIGFDGGSIVINKFSLSSSAEDVAVAVSLRVSDSPNANFSDSQIYAMAVEEAKDEDNGATDAKVLRKGTEIDEEGNVHVSLRRRADTIVTKYIGPLKKYTVGTGDGQAGSN